MDFTPFEQAISEIVEGGKLFTHVKGEENRVVTGLSELWTPDPKIANEMASAIDTIRKKKHQEEKKPL